MTCSSTSSCPTITRRTCRTISVCTWRKRSMRDFKTSGSNCVVTVVDIWVPILFLDGIGLSSGIGAQFQQKVLGLPVARSGFERRESLVFGLLSLMIQFVGARQV